MEDSPNCSYLAKRYLAITRAGRLRGLGSHLIHPENRTAQDTEADHLEFLKLMEQKLVEEGSRSAGIQQNAGPAVEKDASAAEQIVGRP